jgi:hypothetical protein
MQVHQITSMKKLTAILIIGLIAVTGCFYDSEEELYGVNCNTTNVSFSTTVNTLLQQHGCLGCHSGVGASGNVNLQGHANVKNVAESGRLYGAISHSAGFKPMPQGGTKMSECEIKKIKSWIDAGALNN